LGSCVEAIANVNNCKDVDEHSMIGFLIEGSKLLVVVAIKFDPNELKNFRHEFLFVKFKGF